MGDSPRSIASPALLPASLLLETLKLPTWPTVPSKEGNQPLFAAATVIRPTTNELPSIAPAMTRQIRAVAK
jgi:hypothetical protein